MKYLLSKKYEIPIIMQKSQTWSKRSGFCSPLAQFHSSLFHDNFFWHLPACSWGLAPKLSWALAPLPNVKRALKALISKWALKWAWPPMNIIWWLDRCLIIQLLTLHDWWLYFRQTNGILIAKSDFLNDRFARSRQRGPALTLSSD